MKNTVSLAVGITSNSQAPNYRSKLVSGGNRFGSAILISARN